MDYKGINGNYVNYPKKQSEDEAFDYYKRHFLQIYVRTIQFYWNIW